MVPDILLKWKEFHGDSAFTLSIAASPEQYLFLIVSADETILAPLRLNTCISNVYFIDVEEFSENFELIRRAQSQDCSRTGTLISSSCEVASCPAKHRCGFHKREN